MKRPVSEQCVASQSQTSGSMLSCDAAGMGLPHDICQGNHSMFVLKNAWRSVVRNAGRNILIVIIVAVIAAAATIGLAIRNAAQVARDTGLSSTTVTATIAVDRDQMMSGAMQSSTSDGKPDKNAMREALDQNSLSLSDYKKYAKASRVPVTTYYTETTSVNGTDDFQPVETTTSNSERSDSSDSSLSDSVDSRNGGDVPSDQNGQNGQNGQNSQNSQNGQSAQGGHGGFGGLASGDFSLVGFSSDTAVSNASNGSFTMVKGKVFGYGTDSDGQVIIPQALATFNGLKVGSAITVEDLSGSDTTYTLTVAGIYKNDSSTDTGSHGPMGGTSSDPDNAIYTSVSTLKKLGLSTESAAASSDSADSSDSDSATQTSASRTQLSFSYVLGSKDDYETFASDVKKAGLDSTHKVSSADVENYKSSLVPLDNLAKFALTLLIIVLVVGATVLIVINLFNIRERKYEIGVLTAIGITKAKVVAQFVIELLIVTMAGIAIGVAGGAAASVPVSNQLLAQQVSNQESQASSRQAQFGRNADMPGAPGQSSQGGQSGQSADSGLSGQSGTSGQSGQSTDSQSNQPSAPFGKGDARGFGKAVEYVSTINATVNFKIIGELVLIGIALTLISALVGVVAIIRYEPLQILADRS